MDATKFNAEIIQGEKAKEHTITIKVDVDREELKEKLEEISQLGTKLNQEIASIPKMFSAKQVKK